MINFLSLNLWFNSYPGPLQPIFQYVLMAAILLFLAGSAFAWYYRRQNKKNLRGKIWLAVYNFSLTNAVIGILLFFFTYQQVRLLSARFWFVLWAVLIASWTYYIYTKWQKLPDIQKTIDARNAYRKYIP